MNRRAVLLAAWLLTGCSVGPDYQSPSDPAPSRYDLADLPPAERVESQGPTLVMAAELPADWWVLFGSSGLDATEQMARRANNSLAAAKATLAQAEAAITAAQADYYPQLSLGAGVQRNGAGGFTAQGGGTSSNFFSVGPSLSYMVDLFGATGRAVEASRAQADYQRWQWAAADLTVTGGVATEAIAIAAARLQIDRADEILASDQQNLTLVQRQFAVGKAARSDVLTAQSQLLGDQTQMAQLRQQLSVARHALAVLVSQAPADWTPPDFRIEDFTLPAQLPTSLPSALLHHRPDILAAEAQLHAANAAIGVAVAQYYPSISLSAAVTQQSVSPSQLFNSINNLWSVGSNLSAPLFTGFALDAQKQEAVEAFRAQLASYEQTVIVAFGQVADCLRALDHDAEAMRTAQAAQKIAQASLDLQRASYRVGKTSLLQLLTAQRALAQASQTLAQAQSQQLQDAVQFFIAMGGGFSVTK